MPVHNKLVRDKIPEIIEKAGKTFETKILDNDTYIKELEAKLLEEFNEYLTADTKEDSLEELADMMELIKAFAEVNEGSLAEVEKIRQDKASKRGGFNERIYLVEVHDDNN